MLAPATPDAIQQLDTLTRSAVSPDAALRRPLAEVVAATLAAAGRSAHTQRAYQRAIGLFVQQLERERGQLIPAEVAAQWHPFATMHADGQRTTWTFRPPAAVLRLVDAGLLDGFRAWRDAVGDSPNAVATRVAAVRTFLAVAYRDGVLTAAQAQALDLKAYRQRHTPDRQPVGRRLTPAEVRTLRSAVDVVTTKGKRDLAILDLMLFLGLRREEVADVQLGSFRQDGGRWWLVLQGKGRKTRRLKVHDTLYRSLWSWLAAAGLQLDGTGAGPVFRGVNKGDTVTGRPINASVVGRLVAEYGARAQLAPRHGAQQLSPHDLRRTCARNAYDNGANLLLVQAALGHTDPKTTAHYIGAFEQDDHTAIDYVRY